MREPITRGGSTIGYFSREDGNLILDTYGTGKGRFIESDKCIVDTYGTIVGYYDYYGNVVDRDRNIVCSYDGNPALAAAKLLL